MSSIPHLPRFFTYRGMKCECVEINAYGADSSVFLLDVPPNLLLKMADFVPSDIVFRAQVAMYYGLSITNLNVRIQIDDDDCRFYINCKTVSCAGTYKSYASNGLFVRSISRVEYDIGSFSSPFTLKDVELNGDRFDVCGITSGTLFRSNQLTSAMRFFYSYGASITINISNEFDIEDATDGRYHAFGHFALLNQELVSAVNTIDAKLSRYLSPNGSINIEYDHLVIYDQIDDSDRYGLSFKLVIIPRVFNGIEIEDATHYSMTIRPKNADEFFANLIDMDLNIVYQAIEEMVTSMLGDSNALYIPEIVNHEIIIVNGKQWLRVFFTPHICPFTPDILHYSLPSELMRAAMSEYTWLFSGQHGIIFSFPTGNLLHDPSVICYGKADQAIFTNEEYAKRFMLAFTSAHISLRILGRTEGWVTFALIDSSDDEVSRNDLERDHFKIPFIDDFSVEPNSDETALRNIYYTFFSCYNFEMGMHEISKDIAHKIHKMYGNDDMFNTAILWESAINLPRRSWHDTAEKVRNDVLIELKKSADQILEKMNDAHLQMDLTSDDPSPKYVSPDSMDDSPKYEFTVKAEDTSKESKSAVNAGYHITPIGHESIFDKIKKFFK